METVDTVKAIRAGLVAGNILRAHPDSEIIIIPSETHNSYILANEGQPMEYIELRKWVYKSDTFHIGYSEKQYTILVAFPRAL